MWYYSLDDRQTQLFDQYTLSVRWGRNPDGGRQKHYVFDSLEAKNKKIRSLMLKKLKTHKVLYSWFKDKQDYWRYGFKTAEKRKELSLDQGIDAFTNQSAN